MRESNQGTATWSFALSPGAVGRRIDVAPQVEVMGGASMDDTMRARAGHAEPDDPATRWSQLQQLPTFEQDPIDVRSLRSTWLTWPGTG